jgi:hypothetical protein
MSWREKLLCGPPIEHDRSDRTTACVTSVTALDEAQTTTLDPDPALLACASAVLSRAGVRLMRIDGADFVGVWSDLDGPEIRQALRAFGSDPLSVRYLDGDGVPMRFKLRGVDGEPVTPEIREAMERAHEKPWRVRDRMLKEIGWHAKPELWTDGPLRAHPEAVRPEQQDAL